MRRRVLLVACALAAATVGGCDEDRDAGRGVVEEPRRDVVLLVDCSGSTAPFRAQWIPQIVRWAATALEAEQRVSIDCVDGAPLTSMRFELQRDGRDIPPQYDGNASQEERFHVAQALGLRAPLTAELARRGANPGSALLEALEVAADLNPREIRFWTDGLVIQLGDGIDFTRALTEDEREQLVRTWGERLERLRGVPVTVYGVGTGGPTSDRVRRARETLDAIAAQADIQLTWSRIA